MRKVILGLIFVLSVFTGYSQISGESSYKVKLIPAAGTGKRLTVFDQYGKAVPLANGSDGQNLQIVGGVVTWVTPYNYTVQTLTGTTPTWTVSSGMNAKITLTAATNITMSGLVAGTSGNLTVTNAVTSYLITISGYTSKISRIVYSSTGTLLTSGGSKVDVFSWYYDGTNLLWNGGLDYK